MYVLLKIHKFLFVIQQRNSNTVNRTANYIKKKQSSTFLIAAQSSKMSISFSMYTMYGPESITNYKVFHNSHTRYTSTLI